MLGVLDKIADISAVMLGVVRELCSARLVTYEESGIDGTGSRFCLNI